MRRALQRDRSPVSHLVIALGSQAALVALLGFMVGPHAWDDGAITLAYAKTFAETGRIAVTAASEQVEGFSSVAWFLLHTLVALSRPTFEGAILASQLAAGACLGVATIFVWLIARELRLRSGTTVAVLLVFSFLGPSVSEVANGMEMTLLAASGLALVYALYFREDRLLLVCAVAVFLTSRFEAMFYYAALLLPLLAQRRRRRFVVLAALGLLVVCLLEIARVTAFGDVLPNTVRAKTHPPYSSAGTTAVWSRLTAGTEVAAVLLPLGWAVGVFIALTRRARQEVVACLRAPATIPVDVLVLLAPIVAIVVFSLVTGKNWGHTGRMPFLAFPFALLLCGLLFDRFAALEESSNVWTTRVLLVGVSIATVLFSWQQSAGETLRIVAWTVAGNGSAVAERFAVTPASYRKTGFAVDRLRQLAGLDTVVFLTPDVGGLGLCCDRVRVVDIGLLTNRRLARDGYRALPEVLREELPDAIEVHDIWAATPHIYGLAVFSDGYQAALVGSTRLYIRDPLVEPLLKHRTVRWCQVVEAKCREKALVTHRYVEHTTVADDAAFLRRGQILIIGD